jgi:methionyl-tRNA formyltransferase
VLVEGTRLLVGCGNPSNAATALELLELQLEGKRRMNAQEFVNGYRPRSGDYLGQ